MAPTEAGDPANEAECGASHGDKTIKPLVWPQLQITSTLVTPQPSHYQLPGHQSSDTSG